MNFRRMFTAIALLALCVGLASAQVITGGNTGVPAGSLTCTASVAVPPQIRSEGMTELIGDIVIQCNGGIFPASGAQILTANVTVSLGTNVTSRLINATSGNAGNPSNTSEALLFIDEPTTDASPAHGPGPQSAVNVCSNTAVGAGLGGCVQYFDGSVGVPKNCTTVAANGTCSTFGSASVANTFQGLVSANQVTFNGIPVLAPVTGGFSRVFRITNVRANASGFGGGALAGTQQLLASISISGSTSLPVNNPVQIAGFIQAGLATTLRNTGNSGGLSVPTRSQCISDGTTAIALLQYSENFGTAFKTRVQPTSSYNGQAGTPAQATPGVIYNSESGLVLTANGSTAGLADYGTRLKAVFNNIPAGVSIFVSTTNLANASSTTPTFPGNTSTTGFAQLVLNESAPDANGFPPLSASTATINANPPVTSIAALSIVNNSATAVWEVITTNPSGLDTLAFGVYESFTANPGANSPPPGTATVNMSFAPTPTVAFSASSGQSASSSLTIPRFADTSSASNLFTIAVCQTVLLYPFVTNQGGFDTGLAIANTSSDPFGTRTQSGSCVMNFYGASAPPPVNTGNIATGTVYTTLASTSASGFQGYMIAVCNFSLAHGFAFVSDVGARNLAMGYLPLIVPTGTGTRNVALEGGLAH